MFIPEEEKYYLVQATASDFKNLVKEVCRGRNIDRKLSEIVKRYPNFRHIAVYDTVTKEAVRLIKNR